MAPHAICWTDECFHGMGAERLPSIVDVAAGRVPRFVVNRDVLSSTALPRSPAQAAGCRAREGQIASSARWPGAAWPSARWCSSSAPAASVASSPRRRRLRHLRHGAHRLEHRDGQDAVAPPARHGPGADGAGAGRAVPPDRPRARRRRDGHHGADGRKRGAGPRWSPIGQVSARTGGAARRSASLTTTTPAATSPRRCAPPTRRAC